MEILGIGLPEILFILLLVLVLINPKDMKATGLTIGRLLRRVVTSPLWQELRSVWAGITHLPYQLMREANLEDLPKTIQQTEQELKNTIAPLQSKALPQQAVQKSGIPPRPAEQTQLFGAWSGTPPAGQTPPSAPTTPPAAPPPHAE